MAATRLQHWVVVVMAVAMPAACTSTEEALIQRGFSPAYAAGYDHGCSSGQEAGGGLFGQTQKDASRYASDSEYTKGWDAGFAKCTRDQEVMEREARARKPSRNK
jgi:hypothetical protein